MRTNELVSIIMPAYNTEKYIAESIRSIQHQTYECWELLIVDDYSTDDTDAVVQPFLSDTRIRYIKNETNSGAAFSRNRALREAKGRWIAFLDSDDLWHPEKLEKQLVFMQTHGYSFSYTDYEEINCDGEKNGVVVTGPRKITKHGMFNYCWPGCLTVMYDAEKIGLIQIENIKKNNDYAMWLRVCKVAECYLLDENLGLYRRGRIGSVSTHGIITMMRWHYRLFRYAEKQSIICSLVNTGRNILWGTYKKLWYVKRKR
nr:glycosyltransferase family 2 protein [Clostridia bacterium]